MSFTIRKHSAVTLRCVTERVGEQSRLPAGAPVVIGHRGASGHRPEHTLASYELAARLGADYLEPDVVATRDGVLVCRHENEISGTTDIAWRPEFADYRATKVVDGVEVTGWFTEDLTLAQLRSLRAVERLPGLRLGNTVYDGDFAVPTLAELLALRSRLEEELDRPLGVYVETKVPSYFAGLGLPLEEPLLADLDAAGLLGPGTPGSVPRVYVQSFELGNLRRLRHELGLAHPLVLLTEPGGAPWDLRLRGDRRTYADLLTPAGLAGLAQDVDGIGPDKRQVIPWTPDGRLGEPTSLVTDAHAAGLVVHPWTFRAENAFLPGEFRSPGDVGAPGDVAGEIAAYLEVGVDGYFTDHPGPAPRPLVGAAVSRSVDR